MSTKKYVNKLLSNWGVGWWQRQENYIALKVATVLPVKQRTGNYGSMDRADWFRDEVAERVRGQESAGGDYEVDLDNEYNCRRRSFHYDIPNDELEETDKPFDLKRDGTRFVMQKFAIRQSASSPQASSDPQGLERQDWGCHFYSEHQPFTHSTRLGQSPLMSCMI
jgi:hypothetical protein